MQREKVEHRRSFSKKERSGILAKSSNKCVHCGKKLTIDNMTIDHFIPVSEGGTNNKLNLIPLCEGCNTDKGAIIYNVNDYCRYLRPQPKTELERYVSEYNEAIVWMSPNNLFKEDVTSCVVDYDILNKGGNVMTLKKKVYFTKALYRDLDEVYDFVSRYNKSINMDCQGEKLKDAISQRYEEGVFYLMRDNQERIQVVFVVQPRVVVKTGKFCLYLEIFINQELKMSPPVKGKSLFYSSSKALFFYYCDVVYEFLRILTSQFGEPVIIDYHILMNLKDKFIDDIVSTVTMCDCRDKSARTGNNDSEVVSLLVSSEVITGEKDGIIKDMKNKSGRFIALYNRGSDIIRDNLAECGKITVYADKIVVHKESDLSIKDSKVLSDVAVGYIKRVKSSGIHIVGRMDEGCLTCQLDYGVLKSTKFSMIDGDYGRSKTVVLFDETRTKDDCYEFNESEGRSYWYVNSETSKFVLNGLIESTLSEKQLKIEGYGDRTYNRMSHGNSKRKSDLYKNISNISEFRFYERKRK